MRRIAFDLAHALREIVVPRLGAADGRAHARESVGGDVTFAIDAEAEAFLAGWVAAHAPQMAFYSEDRGMVAPGEDEPEFVLIELSENTDLERLFWVYGFTRRPARAVVEVIGDLIDRSSLGGGVFDLGSATFDLTRILTGQLDAYVEPGARMVAEVPGMRAEFERVGGGSVVNNSPYDLAAAALCLSEGGAVITDAAGRPLGPYRLLGSDPEFHISCVAAASSGLHAKLLDAVQRGMERLLALDIVAPPQPDLEGL